MGNEKLIYIILFAWAVVYCVFFIWGWINYIKRFKKIKKHINRLNDRKDGNNSSTEVKDS